MRYARSLLVDGTARGAAEARRGSRSDGKTVSAIVIALVVPVSPDAHARWQIRLTSTGVGGFWNEPRDAAQARAGAAPSLIFTWQ